jgi:origin recognition complex subunit 1
VIQHTPTKLILFCSP